MDDDIPFFLNFDSLDPKYKDYIWKFSLLGGTFTGKVVWIVRDPNSHPIMVSIEEKHVQQLPRIIEIPWTAIQCITYEGIN